VSGSFGFPREEEPERASDIDTDGDGVLDADDVCVDLPAGDSPDPSRPGCPMHDSDADGVPDRDDTCPNEPAGEHPDPERPGCPAADTDGDGVFDFEDPCPTTPAGAHPDPDRAGCPDSDTDADGVFDGEDACPEEHQGLHPDPDPARRGCPGADRDHDSVLDVLDACPDEPGAPSRTAARNGCPGLVLIEEGVMRIARPVYFATNRDRILSRSRPVLEALVDALAATPEIARLSIEGHTDDVSDDEYNLQLSRRRAEKVREWLVSHGIEAGRLDSSGFGETCPRQPGTSREARADNRRVEFRIVDPPLSGPRTCLPRPVDEGGR
jgi:outer membrane protein OmpA-like peptidoglycan-associated protein